MNARLLMKMSFVALFALLQLSAMAQDTEIIWSVENRFRLFDYLANHDPERSAALLARYGVSNGNGTGKSLAGYEAIALAGSPFIDGSAGDRKLNSGPWNPDKQGYDTEYARKNRENHRVAFAISDKREASCKWTLNGKVVGTLPCNESFVVDGVPSDFEIIVEFNDGSKRSMKSHVQERRILALGDSYSSGEGNPDAQTLWQRGKSFNGDRRAHSLKFVETPALWWDQRCHRSFWSNQMFASLSIALSDPHSVTTFMQYSCSGAEVFDGLLLPQQTPPGRKKYLENEVCTGQRSNCDNELFSQVSAAVRDMCVTKSSSSLDIRTPGKPWTDKQGLMVDGFVCGDTNAPSIDTILLSIGGNDVGFSHVVAWALMPAETRSRDPLKKAALNVARNMNAACPYDEAVKQQKKYGVCDTPTANSRAREKLPEFYDVLAQALRMQLGFDRRTKVFITKYPNPLQDSKGRLCDEGTFDSNWRTSDKASVQAAWDGISYLLSDVLPPLDARRWGINLTPGEETLVKAPVIDTLNDTLGRKAKELNWSAVDGHLEHYLTHGWCAMLPGRETMADFIISGIPRGGLKGIEPWDWNAYRSRGRWLRTINDALLTQWNDKYEGSSSGSFHPTAEGHYTTGRAIYDAFTLR